MNAVVTAEQQNAILSEYNFIICIDSSGSMAELVKAGASRTRWEAVQESATQFARDLDKIDSDGLDVVLFGGSAGVQSFPGVTADKIKDVFATRSPRGSTPLAEALTAALAVSGGNKKRFIVVFTDGIPDDKNAAAAVIKSQSNRQKTDDECTFLFVQVGDDAGAAAYLKMLDDDLKGAQFDIVDAKTLAEAEAFPTTTALVIHAIND